MYNITETWTKLYNTNTIFYNTTWEIKGQTKSNIFLKLQLLKKQNIKITFNLTSKNVETDMMVTLKWLIFILKIYLKFKYIY